MPSANVVLDRLHDVVCRLRLQQRRHVLEAQRVASEIHEVTGHLDIALDRVQLAHGVAESALGMRPFTLDRSDGALDVAHVVEGVERAEDVHAVLDGLADEAVDDVVLVVAVAEEVLPAQEHLPLGVGQQAAESAQPLPRVFVEEADTGVERRTAPALHAPVPGLVDVLADRDHIFQGHPGGEQALVGIAQGELRDVDLLAHRGDTFRRRQSTGAADCGTRHTLVARQCGTHNGLDPGTSGPALVTFPMRYAAPRQVSIRCSPAAEHGG